MMEIIKLSGIYDKRTLKMAQEIGVKFFEFDFRPRSFNFVQQYVLEEVLESVTSSDDIVSLHFQNEANFVVDNILNSFKDIAIKPQLVFSDTQSPVYYDSFKRPYMWHHSPDADLKAVLKSKYNMGIILSYGYLEDLHRLGTLQSFITNLYVQLKEVGGLNKTIGLKIDWDSNLAPSIFELVDFDFLDLPINDKVEVCYRNVDSTKLRRNIEILKNLAC
ncbi:MAG: hypothetical protein BM556_14560 [Bacteriovorax sp. MedPE-SWde]|nr:MAG: hypothetical protein BM556_14560 [Bacteriovorax sp. MedPE-SWde]